MTFAPGMQFDRYTIEAFLGEGAMGKVYRAFDTRLERAVAIKVLEPAQGAGESVASALHEARAAAAILHPNATAIFDADTAEGTSFIVMELVPGTSLRRLVGEASVSMGSRIRWLVDVAGALAAAHAAGVVHRDVKPENILVRDDGLVKVLDFGIARLPREAGGAFATIDAGGDLLGTPAYMAPEQIRGEAIDGRADQFAWGVLAYELLTGRLPWGAISNPVELMAAVLANDPEPFAADAEVPATVVAAVYRAMAKAAGDRFPSMVEAAAPLTAFAGTRRPLHPPGTPRPDIVSRPVTDPPPSFSEQIAPAASSIVPSPPSSPSVSVDPVMRTLASARDVVEVAALVSEVPPISSPVPASVRVAVAGPRLRAPDFSAPVDVDGHLVQLPPDATCKGIFFIELARLGATAISPHELFHLAGFPERRYVAFRDYPAGEYMRLAVAVALAVHSTLPLGEALRRIGQTAFATASQSLVGKTLFGVYGRDLEPLLFTAPRAYRLFLNFGEVSVERLAVGHFRFEARDLPAFLETYQIGVIEGLLEHAGAEGRLRIALAALDRATVELEVL